MKVYILKPNKSTPYWRLFIEHPLGFYVGVENKIGKYVEIYLTKKQLKKFKKEVSQ